MQFIKNSGFRQYFGGPKTTDYGDCVCRTFEGQEAIDRVDLRPVVLMAMDYTVWYSQTLRCLPERQGAPFRAPRLIQDRQQSANIVQQANRKGLTIAEDRRRRQSLHAAEMRTLEMIIGGGNLTDILKKMCAANDCY